ncbi:hypothetical protein CK203_100621 [Vitis vinifera]|uniref:Integrase catalytic domain-containing protein n=1 Tax=Vitis vinifera TaxID=29760 RepID=A0A438FIG3_VITVI|nr:hypothetical protein CK203_100621 [Vitis vinifera]
MDEQHYRIPPDRHLPGDPKQAHKVRVQAARFTIIGGTCTSDPSQDPTFGPWPFAQWGMDIVGPLPAAPAQKKFLLVATDYFSKWVEAEAYASIKDKDVTKSHKQNSNHCLKEKARTSQRKVGGRVTRRPVGLSNHTRTPTGNTPFALAYGMDAVIPTEIGLPTIRTEAANRMMQAGQTRPPALLFALISAAAIFLCFFSIETSVRRCLTSPSKEPPHPPPHASGPPSNPPGSLPQLNPPGEPRCPPSGDKLASASSSLKRS